MALSAAHRLPPQNLDAEQCVLGSVLLQPGAITRVLEVLSPEDFYREAHKTIFAAMVELFEKTEPQDLITVTNLLRDKNKLDAVGGPAYLAGLTDIVPVAANISFYGKIVRQKAILRRLIATSSEIASRCYEEQDDIDTLVDEAEQTIFEISRSKSGQQFQPLSRIIPNTFKALEKRFERKELITGVPTGYLEFDRMTAGLQPSDLIILAARPSMGKTALALNIAKHAAMAAGLGVAIFSLEMSEDQLAMRMLCSESRVDSQRLRTGFLKDRDWPRLTKAAGDLSEAPIFIDDTPGISALEMRAKSRRLKSEHDIGLVVVDYLQLMQGSASAERREQEISEISRSLKAMAKELKIPVMALSQLNRSLENRPDKRPKLSDLRECVTGDTLVLLTDGQRVPIRELTGKQPEVWALGESGQFVAARSDKVWSVGTRPVWAITLASGRRLVATAQHRLYGANGWLRVEELKVGDRLALARKVSQRDTLFWDRVAAIEPAGEQEVFDLTVPGPASWLADGIVSHNSGAIEQDADVICFIYRDEVYNTSEDNPKRGLAEIIIGKQRNGPTGKFELTFIDKYTAFENYINREVPQGFE